MIPKIEDTFEAGYVVKKVGFNGLVSLKLGNKFPVDYKKMAQVYLDINGSLVPFSITECRSNGKFLRTKFVGVDTETKAEQLVGKRFRLPLDTLPKLNDGFYFFQIENFEVFNQDQERIGTVDEVIENDAQAIVQVKHDTGKGIMVPLSNDLILDVNFDEKFIQLDIADGLVDLYLNEG